MSLNGRSLVAAMCAGQVGNLLPHVVVPAVMAAHLIPLWGLSAAQAGLMAGAYAFGYMLAVPVLATLTDRIDARLVLIAGSAFSGLATAAFGLFAQGLWSATAIWALAGMGFAGAYMPGLKALTDRLPPRESSRSITLYTSSFSIGVGLSFLVSQLLADAFNWRAAFFVTALGPLVMIAACFAIKPFRPAPAQGRLLDFRPVLRNRAAMGYVLGYGAHCFELYGMRTWVVAFWTFVAARNGDAALLSPVAVSVIGDVPLAAGKHSRQRGRAALRPPPCDHGRDGGLRRGSPRDRDERRRLAALAARAGADLRRHDPGGLGRAHVGHGRQRGPGKSRSHDGATLDRWLRPAPRSAAGPAGSRSMRRAGRRALPAGSPSSRCSRSKSCSGRSRCGGRGEGSLSRSGCDIGQDFPDHHECRTRNVGGVDLVGDVRDGTCDDRLVWPRGVRDRDGRR